jgi:thiol:disulfide interchange protein
MAGEILLAVAAGLLLNLTPCVLAAMPVKIRTIAYESGHQPAQRMLAAAVFTTGSLLFFLGLGIATAALHWIWGALFQSRLFLILLIASLCLFAFITFQDIGVPVPQFAQTVRGRRYLEPFLSGMFSALLATPCTGPFLGGVLAFAVTRPPAVIIALFLAVGLGLALPYIVLLAWPGLLNRLPRAGSWSEAVRQGLAFVLLAAAAFFAQSLVPAGAGGWIWLGWLALLALWAGYTLVRSAGWAARAVAAGFTVAGVALVYAGGLAAPARTGPLNWQPLVPHSLQQARTTRRPILIEFTADWCINCKVLEKTAYADPQVVHAVRDHRMITLQADLTRPDPWLAGLLASYDGAGLPFAVVLNGDEEVVQRFSGLFTAGALVRAINKTAKDIHEK